MKIFLEKDDIATKVLDALQKLDGLTPTGEIRWDLEGEGAPKLLIEVTNEPSDIIGSDIDARLDRIEERITALGTNKSAPVNRETESHDTSGVNKPQTKQKIRKKKRPKKHVPTGSPAIDNADLEGHAKRIAEINAEIDRDIETDPNRDLIARSPRGGGELSEFPDDKRVV